MKTNSDFRKNILNFVESMRREEDPITHYRLFSRAEANPFASCFAIFIKYMFNDVEFMPDDEKKQWINYFISFQNKDTGLFSDPNAFKRVADEHHDTFHLDLQFTTFCVSALDCLGVKARYPFRFLRDFYTKHDLYNWLNTLNWENSSNSGNKVMFIAICAIYNFEEFNDKESKVIIDNWFSWMDSNQNANTGFWGSGRHTNYFNGMLGFYHQYLIYNYLERDVNSTEDIIDRCLFLQLPDGGYNPELGGASCDDVDAIHILVYLYHNYDYRRKDIRASLEKSLNLIMKNQNKDHGFCWSKHYWYNVWSYPSIIYNLIKKRDIYFSYLTIRGVLRGQKKDFIKQKVVTGWSINDRKERESSLFDTWFRCNAIGLIQTVLKTDNPKIKIGLLKSPGLGWFDENKSKII